MWKQLNRKQTKQTHQSNMNTMHNDQCAKIAAKESVFIYWLRLSFLITVSVIGTVASVAFYRTSSKGQLRDFTNEFEGYSTKIGDAIAKVLDRKVAVADSLSVALTSESRARGINFPFVTLPDFVLRGSAARILAETPSILWTPLVEEDKRQDWEAFLEANHSSYFYPALVAEENQHVWQDKRFGLNSSVSFDLNGDIPSYQIRDFHPDGALPAANNSGPYLPVFDTSPKRPSFAGENLNLLSHPAAGPAFREALTSGHAVFGECLVLDEENFGFSAQTISKALYLSQYRHDMNGLLGDPTTLLTYPVFDTLDEKHRTVVGVVGMRIFWTLILRDLLPEQAGGFVAVFRHCNTTFTYEIKGSDATYMGSGDQHDPATEEWSTYSNLALERYHMASPETRSYSRVEIGGSCHISVHIYPTAEFHQDFVNGKPLAQSLFVASIFVVAIFLFAAYDFLVGRRQRIVLTRALASGAIVNSLFPRPVVEQLYQRPTEDLSDEYEDEATISEHYPETTLFFADMAGFTQWSRDRSPHQVFFLLNRLFGSFDAIAKKWDVYKIETVGDSYIAVAGLPHPQEDHALRVAQFATECLRRFDVVMTCVCKELGDDRMDLALRVGLHSGPVQGGILRGDKKRFQLYGSAVNFASRMETCGLPGRIHASKATADELVRLGKQIWVKARDGQVSAKGLGKLETFWIESDDSETSSLAVSQTTVQL